MPERLQIPAATPSPHIGTALLDAPQLQTNPHYNAPTPFYQSIDRANGRSGGWSRRTCERGCVAQGHAEGRLINHRR